MVKGRPYLTLALIATLHFFIMLALTYVGVNAWEDIFLNLNRAYMAVLMVTPMVVVMLVAMRHMFPKPALSLAIGGVAALVFVATFAAEREQTFVGDRQFLRSMIPHHSIAIKTCRQAQISDPEILGLCQQIVQAQRAEISQMRAILERLD